MTNFDKFKWELIQIHLTDDFGVSNNQPHSCKDIGCENCKFKKNCKKLKREWLNAEYQEGGDIDWTTVEPDTLILVRNNNSAEWDMQYFARYINGKVYSFKDGAASNQTDQVVPWKYAKLYEDE